MSMSTSIIDGFQIVGLDSLARIATLDGGSSILRVLDEFILHVVAVKRNTVTLDKLVSTSNSQGGFKRRRGCGGGRSSRFLRRASKHRATTGASKRRRGCGGGRSSRFLRRGWD